MVATRRGVVVVKKRKNLGGGGRSYFFVRLFCVKHRASRAYSATEPKRRPNKYNSEPKPLAKQIRLRIDSDSTQFRDKLTSEGGGMSWRIAHDSKSRGGSRGRHGW